PDWAGQLQPPPSEGGSAGRNGLPGRCCLARVRRGEPSASECRYLAERVARHVEIGELQERVQSILIDVQFGFDAGLLQRGREELRIREQRIERARDQD